MFKKIYGLLILCSVSLTLEAQVPKAVKNFVSLSSMRGASASVVVKEITSGHVVCDYQPELKIVPASVAKTVTTATMLELFGSDYRYPTEIEYDGTLTDGVLDGNLYIHGHGDPTIGSHYFSERPYLDEWTASVARAGIRQVKGRVIADESLFDEEGISSRWIKEDLGNYYASGCYGVNIHDNSYTMYVNSTVTGRRPQIVRVEPQMSGLRFHNYLVTTSDTSEEPYIFGAPFLGDRFLYGGVPYGRSNYSFKGDIPDPPLYAAGLLSEALKHKGIEVSGEPSTFRIESEENRWSDKPRTVLTTTYSPVLSEIVKETNYRSINLFADAMMKSVGVGYKKRVGEVISSFGEGVAMMRRYWNDKGLNADEAVMYDGCGLSPADRLTGGFLADLLVYMATQSKEKESYMQSFPLAGSEGSVVRFLQGTHLSGKARMKSGSMNGVRCFAGYVEEGSKRYAVVCMVNNYTCSGNEIRSEIERMLLSLFGK